VRAQQAAFALAGLAMSRVVGESPGRLGDALDYVWTDVQRTLRARRRLDALRAHGSLQTAEDLDVSAVKRSGTVFILGSGSSILDLTDADWAFIAAHDSIGFNYWLLHPFVPDFYFVEVGTGPPEEDAYIASLLTRRLAHLGQRRTPVVVESKCWLRPEGYSIRLPEPLKPYLYFYAPFYLRTTSTALVGWVMRRCRRYWRRGSGDLRGMVHHRASLSALTLFAFLEGYEDIVLVGVDLNDSRYFWEADESILGDSSPPPTAPESAVHMTVDPAATAVEVAIPIDEYLRRLDATVLRPAGVTLWVTNPASRLTSFLPVYPGLSPGAAAAGAPPQAAQQQP